MNEKKTPVWVKVFIFMLASIVAALCGLWILFGWLVALIGGAGWLALYIPAIIIISLYAALFYTFYEADGDFDEWSPFGMSHEKDK